MGEFNFVDELVVSDLKVAEGYNPTTYVDTLGFTHVGYGFCVDGRVDGAGLTEEECEAVLRIRVRNITIQILNKAYSGEYPNARLALQTINDVRMTVLIMMAYQLGVSGLFKFEKMFAALANKDYSLAADEMCKSKWYDQAPKRVSRLADIMESGVYRINGGL